MAAVDTDGFRESTLTVGGRLWRAEEYYRLALSCLSAGTDEGRQAAMVYFRNLVEQLDRFGEGWFQLARLSFYGDGDLETACAQAELGRQGTPENANYHLLYAVMAAATGRVDEANAAFRDASALRPGLAEPASAGESAEINLDPHLVRYMHSMLGEILPNAVFVSGRLLRADSLMEEALDLLYSPKTDEQEQGEEILVRLVASSSASEPAFHLALRQIRKSALEKARGVCSSALSYSPNDWRLLALRGYILLRCGLRDEGVHELGEAALRNHHLPLLEGEKVDDSEVDRLSEWYEQLFERAPKAPGGFAAEWNYPPPLAQIYDQQRRSTKDLYAAAWSDVRRSFGESHLWLFLARNDMIGRYRRTVLGPWWIVMGTAVALGGMAVVWSVIFGLDRKGFLPYLASGYLIWMFVAAVLTEGCDCFAGGQAVSVQKNIPCGQFVHVLRLVARLSMMMMHQSVIVVLAILFGSWHLSWSILLLPIALILLLITATAVVALIGTIGARYRDFGPALAALLNVLFFLTPVVWKPEMLGGRAALAALNPLTHYIDIVRAPIIGADINVYSWIAACSFTAILIAVSFHVFALFRARIVYWL